jgi:hypothetical protein
MPRNWLNRERKIESRKTKMPHHGGGLLDIENSDHKKKKKKRQRAAAFPSS